jgi:hypothetical protein
VGSIIRPFISSLVQPFISSLAHPQLIPMSIPSPSPTHPFISSLVHPYVHLQSIPSPSPAHPFITSLAHPYVHPQPIPISSLHPIPTLKTLLSSLQVPDNPRTTSFTCPCTLADPDLYVARASLTRSCDKLLGGSAVSTSEISWRTKMRSTMYAARYVAVDAL